MRLDARITTVHTRTPFVIARYGASEFRTVRITVTDVDGAEGWGEAAPNRFYGESPESVLAALDRFAPLLEKADAWSLEAIEASLHTALRFNGSAKSGLTAALHDLAAKRLGAPLYRLWGLDPARAPRSSYTIAIAEDDATLRERVEAAADWPILKIKLGTDRDERIARVVREAAPGKVLRVDANAAWTAKRALRIIPFLEELGVEFVEQPLPAHDLEGLRFVRERSRLPVVADESCLTSHDVARLAGLVDGINLKLSKCGGVREALKMIATARAHGMLVMCGCMVESTLGIAPAAHFASLLDAADLDGAALLADDPYAGPSVAGGVITVPDAPGLGVTVRAG